MRNNYKIWNHPFDPLTVCHKNRFGSIAVQQYKKSNLLSHLIAPADFALWLSSSSRNTAVKMKNKKRRRLNVAISKEHRLSHEVKSNSSHQETGDHVQSSYATAEVTEGYLSPAHGWPTPCCMPQHNAELLGWQVTEPHCRQEIQSFSISLIPCVAVAGWEQLIGPRFLCFTAQVSLSSRELKLNDDAM